MLGDRWGVSDGEVARWYPCDEIVARPVLEAWRGVTVKAQATVVWPWVTQVRLAPYSYDWIDNLGRSSPGELRGLPDPIVGEQFTTAAGRRLGRILSVDVGTQLTGRLGNYVMSYVLEPQHDSTRLVLKIVASSGRLSAPLICLGDLVMARRQLLNFKALAEASVPTPR